MFEVGRVYNRREEIHLKYGGNWQSGIAASSTNPFIFIFSGSQGKHHGYEDGWDNPNVFSYSGEGQEGDMKLNRGNLALTNHVQEGKRVFLFTFVSKGFWRFEGELEVLDFSYGEVIDRNGDLRKGIRFFFKRKGIPLPYTAEQYKPTLAAERLVTLQEIDKSVPTEKQTLVTSRVGQGAYRKRIIHRWEGKCAVTGFQRQDILIASHIVPWSEADNKERLDVNNGILLSPVYDALFDRRLISFEDSGKIILSNKIEHSNYLRVGVTGKERIKNFNIENQLYLEKHRKMVIL